MMKMPIGDASYDKLVVDYGGKTVLLRDEKAVLADSSTKVVLSYAKKHFRDKNWRITKIDLGEAALYGVQVSNTEYHAEEGPF
jgi:hypothetical protein